MAKLDILDKATREKMRKRATTKVKIIANLFAVLFCCDVFGRWIEAILGYVFHRSVPALTEWRILCSPR